MIRNRLTLLVYFWSFLKSRMFMSKSVPDSALSMKLMASPPIRDLKTLPQPWFLLYWLSEGTVDSYFYALTFQKLKVRKVVLPFKVFHCWAKIVAVFAVEE